MRIIGEKINTINPRVRRALEERDASFIQNLAMTQVKAGAQVIDVNVGSHPSVEPENMRWAVRLVQEVIDWPLAIDSSNPATIQAGLEACRNPSQAWANSISFEPSRLDGILPAVAEYGCYVIGLCMATDAVPPTAGGRLEVAQRLVEEVARRGVSPEKLYLDALVEPISVTPGAALVNLETIRAIRRVLPDIKTIICLTAISYGLPARRLLNRTFASLLLEAGVDAIILDPLDRQLRATLKAANALLGHDAHGLEYIAAYRRKQLG